MIPRILSVWFIGRRAYSRGARHARHQLRDPAKRGHGPPPDSGRLPLALALELVALVRIQDSLADPDALGRDLDELVVRDPLERFLERHVAGGREDDHVVLAGGSH